MMSLTWIMALTTLAAALVLAAAFLSCSASTAGRSPWTDACWRYGGRRCPPARVGRCAGRCIGHLVVPVPGRGRRATHRRYSGAGGRGRTRQARRPAQAGRLPGTRCAGVFLSLKMVLALTVGILAAFLPAWGEHARHGHTFLIGFAGLAGAVIGGILPRVGAAAPEGSEVQQARPRAAGRPRSHDAVRRGRLHFRTRSLHGFGDSGRWRPTRRGTGLGGGATPPRRRPQERAAGPLRSHRGGGAARFRHDRDSGGALRYADGPVDPEHRPERAHAADGPYRGQAGRLPVFMSLPMLLLVVPGILVLVGGPVFVLAIRALQGSAPIERQRLYRRWSWPRIQQLSNQDFGGMIELLQYTPSLPPSCPTKWGLWDCLNRSGPPGRRSSEP